jgi:hypothetical protein
VSGRSCLVSCGFRVRREALDPETRRSSARRQAGCRGPSAPGREGRVLEEVLEEQITEHLRAGYRELTPTRRGERNGHYQCNLLTPAGKIERLEVPRDREGEFVTEVFERYKRMTGDVEEAVLEMYLSGISV